MFLWTVLLNLVDPIFLKPKTHTLDLDETLLARIGQRDREAFNEFYALTEKILYSYILSIVKDHHTTNDLLQETYLKIMNSAHLYQPMGKPMAWVFTMAKRLCYDYFRESKRKSTVDFDDIDNVAEYTQEETRHTHELLEIALSILNEEEREIVLLSAITGLKHREIAENLDMKLSTVLSKYHRAIKKMREHLKKEGIR